MKICPKCKKEPSLPYHAYCYGCARIARGQSATPKFHRDPNNRTMCSRCKSKLRAPGHRYCRQCRNLSVREWVAKKGGDWAYITADIERHKKALARQLINNWIKRGKILRRPCEMCGNPNTTAHHDNYDRPDQVRWLCREHHSEADKKKESLDRIKEK